MQKGELITARAILVVHSLRGLAPRLFSTVSSRGGKGVPRALIQV